MTDRATVRELVNSLLDSEQYPAALKLVRAYCIGDEEFIDETVARFLALAKKSWSTDLDYEDVCRAVELLPLGASVAARERVLAALINIGFHNHAEDVATKCLWRQLTVNEVQALVDHYCNGAVSSTTEVWQLTNLATKAGGQKFRDKVTKQIAKREQEFRQWDY